MSPSQEGPFDPGVQPPLTGALGLWVWDLAGERVRGDARFAALIGLPADELQAGVAASVIYGRVLPEDRLRLIIAVAGVAQGAEVFARDFRVAGEDGVRWLRARGRAEQPTDHRPRSFTGVLNDVTEQKRTEERLRVAQSAGGVGTFEYVDGFGTVAVSDHFCRLLGLRPTQSLPIRTINGLVCPEDPPLIGGPATDAGAIRSEVRIRRADNGEFRWLTVQGERRPGGDAAGPATIGAVYDITAAKLAESRLRELAHTLEERVEARTQERDRLWNTSRDLFGVLGRDGLYRAANPAWRQLLGYEEADVVGRSFHDFVHPDDLEAAGLQWAGGDGVALEGFDARMRDKAGGWRWVNWTVIPQGDALYAVGRDVTERKQLEQQLRQSQKMEAVGQLTGGIAHDFNNMLTGILGGLDMVQRRLAEGRTADAERFIAAAVASAERAAGLTHRLLAFSRQQSLDPRSVDANALVGSMADLLRRTLGERVDLGVELATDLWPTAVDANQLESTLLNLAINARDAMSDGGKLTIETANVSLGTEAVGALQPGDYVQLSVSDTGCGMTPQVMARVFDPFFTTKPLGQGTGLGMSMVFGFARQSGGDVTVHSEVGHGTTVRLYLPRHAGAAPDAAEPAEHAEPPIGAGETVLVVEDDASVRAIVVNLLDELGYVVLEASAADAALDVLRSERRLDLLVSDVGLPGLNGRQLAELARESRPQLPVLFMTGYAAGAARRSEFLGADMEMISKPFAIDGLAQKVCEMMGRDPSSSRGPRTPPPGA